MPVSHCKPRCNFYFKQIVSQTLMAFCANRKLELDMMQSRKTQLMHFFSSLEKLYQAESRRQVNMPGFILMKLPKCRRTNLLPLSVSKHCNLSYAYASSAPTENTGFTRAVCLIGQPPARISCVTTAHRNHKRADSGSASCVTSKRMFFIFYSSLTISYRSPAVDADGHIVLLLEHTHVLQQLQNGGDGVWYTMIRPVHIVQLLQRVR